jgi:hypothetical protein
MLSGFVACRVSNQRIAPVRVSQTIVKISFLRKKGDGNALDVPLEVVKEMKKSG